MSRDFVHLRLHTDYTLLESSVRLNNLAAKLNELKMQGCAVTDKGNMYCAISFYNTLKANNLKPIIGYEAFLTFGSRHEREAALKAGGEAPYYELNLLATNLKGYQNLVQLSSKAFTEGFFHKPRIDCELLSEHCDGLIALSGGLRGVAAHYLKQKRFADALEKICLLKEIFGSENFFLEIQDHDLEIEKQIRAQLLELSKRAAIPLVATNEVYYLEAADAQAQDILLCIKNGSTIKDASRATLGSNKFYLRSAEEMWRVFGEELPHALRSTTEIFERCQPELPRAEDKDYLPRYPIPRQSGCQTIEQYFEQIAWQGFERRNQKVWNRLLSENLLKYDLEVYKQRLRREIEIIKQMGYAGYFLIVWDFVAYAKQKNIPVGPGRGSAAGSLAAYCLEITDIDPIQYDLLFERFLNPERVSMPDIDIDFCVRGRDAVIRHVIERYGRECVCQIVTFGTMASRAVIKDVGRALAMPLAEVEKIAKMIPPPVRGRNVSITQALEQVEELKKLLETNSAAAKLLDIARRLEGCARHTSVHAAGVVIAPAALHTLIPVAASAKSDLTTQYAMSDLEKTGMLKMDFLALTTLTIISDCLMLLSKENIYVAWETVRLDDPKTMRIFGEGKTEAIFQFESPGMQEICRRLKPKNIEDLSALNALYRPGPLDGGMVDDFIARHKGQKAVRYIVPQMKEILQNTFGILVYQEQIMQLAQKLAGYSLGEADLMRRAMGKKKREEMARHSEKFVKGAVERGIKKEKAEQIFNLMAQFADYGFNRSHSVAYAYLAFQTAYLKAHHPTHFYAAVLSHETQDAAKIYKYGLELQEIGLRLLPPDINESVDNFTPLKNGVRFGLNAIKGLGESSARAIIKARGTQPFASLFDFVKRIGIGSNSLLNRRGLEALIFSGALDSLNKNALPIAQWRANLFASIDTSLSYARKARQDADRGQQGLFSDSADALAAATAATEPILQNAQAWSSQDVCKNEKQALGFYLTSHPLDAANEILSQIKVTAIADLTTNADSINESSQEVCAAGIINNLQIRNSKSGNRFAIFKLEDRTGNIKCLLWEEAFKKCFSALEADKIVQVYGKLKIENENSPTLVAHKILPLAEAQSAQASQVFIKSKTNHDEIFYEELLALLNKHKGRCKVFLELCLRRQQLSVCLATHAIVSVQGSLELENELKKRGCEVVWRTNTDAIRI
jgi:DNA polymerase-3 subunit alpha